MDNLPPIDHRGGFRSNDDVKAYLFAFADRPDNEIVSFDLWGRPTTFGDLRRLVGPKEAQKTMSFDFGG